MLDNLTLKNKLTGLEFVSFIMFVAMAAFGLFQLHGAIEGEKESVTRLNADMNVLEYLGTMDIAFLKEVKISKELWIRGTTPDKIKTYRDQFTEQQDLFEQNYDKALAGLNQLAAGHQGFDGFIDDLNKVDAEHKNMVAKYLAQFDAHRGNTLESDTKTDGIDQQLLSLIHNLRGNLIEFMQKKGEEKVAMAEADFSHRRNLVILWVLVSLGLTSFLATAIIRQVSRQLGADPKQVAQVVNSMAAGDFSQAARHRPPAGSLLANAYRMQTALREMIVKVKEQANQVGDMAHNLASSAKQIAGNVNHESDAVSSMAASIEEMSVSTTHISDQGSNARRIANDSRSNTEQGAQVVNKTVSGLLVTAQEIERASGDVSRLGQDATRIIDVVKVIKDIAEQTNLLALNAAIEAARAGEQGRGFAVVADEVRKLAERTAGATNEINQMTSKIGEVADHALKGMDNVVTTTRQGVTDAETAQASIAGIQQSFSEVSGVIDEISAALAEQNVAANELAKNTERVAQMSAENSSAAQQLLQLANGLEARADQVRGAVEAFTV